MFQLLTVIFMILIAIFLKIVYKMNWSGALSICLFAIISYFLFTKEAYYLFFVAFGFLGLIKLLRQFIAGYSDVNKYDAYTFLYTMLIPLALSFSQNNLLLPIIFCGIGTLLVDTASGELGQSFKTATYLITTFEKVPTGTDGGVSLIGTSLGLVCGLVYIFGCGYLLGINYLSIILLISFLGSLIDSITGALLQRKGYINNQQNNLISTIFVTIISSIVFLVIL